MMICSCQPAHTGPDHLQCLPAMHQMHTMGLLSTPITLAGSSLAGSGLVVPRSVPRGGEVLGLDVSEAYSDRFSMPGGLPEGSGIMLS